jgi:hypothetical protein
MNRYFKLTRAFDVHRDPQRYLMPTNVHIDLLSRIRNEVRNYVWKQGVNFIPSTICLELGDWQRTTKGMRKRTEREIRKYYQ